MLVKFNIVRSRLANFNINRVTLMNCVVIDKLRLNRIQIVRQVSKSPVIFDTYIANIPNNIPQIAERTACGRTEQ